MPSVVLPLVRPEIGTNIFTCPRCGEKCKTHILFVEHWTAAHAPDIGVRQRGPSEITLPPPKAVGGDTVSCPVCNVRFPGADYPKHAASHTQAAPVTPLSAGLHTGAGLTTGLLFKTEVK
jgi:hypothetical protein